MSDSVGNTPTSFLPDDDDVFCFELKSKSILTVNLSAKDMTTAIEAFKIVFGELLFKEVDCITNIH